LVKHTLDARVALRLPERWRAEAAASATTGTARMRMEPSQIVTPGSALAPTSATGSMRYDALQATARGGVTVEPRTTLDLGVTWSGSRGGDAAARVLFPVQRALSAEVSLARLATELDSLQLQLSAASTATDAAHGRTASSFATAMATWRRRIDPRTDGWLGGGASLGRTELERESPTTSVLAAAEAGLSRASPALTISLSARIANAADRLTGEVSPVGVATSSLRWAARERLTIAGSAAGGGRTDGATAFGSVDLRAAWTFGHAAVEAGVVGGCQRDRRLGIPVVFEGGVVAAVSYTTAWLFRGPRP
jgi:hypothetical protein